MFLSLSLGVKFNVLNAQSQGTVEIGQGSDDTSSELPTQTK